ncbi:MAG: DUF3189 family protein [Carboxydocellales bacterium]
MYGCITGVHTSLLAAAFHLGWFDSKLKFQECRAKMPMYGTLTYKQIGQPLFWGCDEHQREVFTIGLAMERQIFCYAIHDLFGLYNYSSQDYYFVDTSDYGGKLVKAGSEIAGLPLIRPLGEALIANSLSRNREVIADMVSATKAYLDTIPAFSTQ